MQIAKKKKKGFTLIELLVVIAIIGILASIVLVSLSGAKARAKDARIQSDMNQIRSTAEMFYNTNNNYTSLATDPSIVTLMADIDSQCPGCASAVTIKTGNDGYCVVTQLNSKTAWCVDSGLRSYATPTSPTTCTAAATAACE